MTLVSPGTTADFFATPVSKGFKRLAYLYRRQGGLCSLCGGRMLLINLMALKPGERKKMRKREPERFGLMASVDHDEPRSVGRGKAFNRNAAHRACNELKGSQLIQAFPLPCIEEPTRYRNIPPIHLGDGRTLEMVDDL